MSTNYNTVLLFGGPGAGKGTQGKILGSIPGFYHLSTGDMFRGMDKSTPLGQEIGGYMSKGDLVPDALTVRLFGDHLAALSASGEFSRDADLLILDGIPRNVPQAEALAEHIDVLAIVHLVCRDRDEIVKRLQRRALQENRADDAKEEVVRRRWDIYSEETQPVLDHYPSDSIHEVDAMDSPAGVLQRVLAALVPVRKAHFGNPFERSTSR